MHSTDKTDSGDRAFIDGEKEKSQRNKFCRCYSVTQCLVEMEKEEEKVGKRESKKK